MGYLSYLEPARDLFFKQGDLAGAEALLKPLLEKPGDAGEKRAVVELLALILREQGRFEEALALYETIQDAYQAGYCALLMGRLHTVQQQWTRVLMLRQNHWCVSLYGMVTQQLRTYPTLFQVRNHLECDIANLIAASQTPFLENLLYYIDFLTQINLESPKFAGRALMNAGRLDKAGAYLIKGQKALPNDPEIYFHLGQYSILQKHYTEAGLMLKQCLLISPTYSPAINLLNELPETA